MYLILGKQKEGYPPMLTDQFFEVVIRNVRHVQEIMKKGKVKLVRACGRRGGWGRLTQALYELRWELFTFREAEASMGFGGNRLRVAFSALHSKRAILLFEKPRPRRYRLVGPENFIWLASGQIKNVEKIPQECYVKLVLDSLAACL